MTHSFNRPVNAIVGLMTQNMAHVNGYFSLVRSYLMLANTRGFLRTVENTGTIVDISQEQRVDEGGLAQASLPCHEDHKVES